MSPALHHAAVRRRHRAIVRTGAEQEEIVLGAERLHVPLELDRKLVLAHAGTRDVEQARVAELGDAGGLARVGDLFVGLGGGGVEHDVVGGAAPAAAPASCGRRCPTRRTQGRRCRACRRASVTAAARIPAHRPYHRRRSTRSSGQHSAARSASHAGVTIRLASPSRAQHDRRGPERLEAAQHHHRIGLLDEMRAVVHGDQRIELRLAHAGADVGEAFVEGHGVFLGLPLGSITAWTRQTVAGNRSRKIELWPAAPSAQIPSGPPASPRSVSANSSSSGRIRLIMPCWCM